MRALLRESVRYARARPFRVFGLSALKLLALPLIVVSPFVSAKLDATLLELAGKPRPSTLRAALTASCGATLLGLALLHASSALDAAQEPLFALATLALSLSIFAWSGSFALASLDARPLSSSLCAPPPAIALYFALGLAPALALGGALWSVSPALALSSAAVALVLSYPLARGALVALPQREGARIRPIVALCVVPLLAALLAFGPALRSAPPPAGRLPPGGEPIAVLRADHPLREVPLAGTELRVRLDDAGGVTIEELDGGGAGLLPGGPFSAVAIARFGDDFGLELRTRAGASSHTYFDATGARLDDGPLSRLASRAHAWWLVAIAIALLVGLSSFGAAPSRQAALVVISIALSAWPLWGLSFAL